MFGRRREGRGRDTPILKSIDYLEDYYKKTVEYLYMIPFASSRQWSKLILEILSSILDHPKGRGRATPIFRYKMITGKRFNIFA